MISQPSVFRRPSAFSLVEVALSIAIVAIVVLAAVGLLVPAQRSIDESLTAAQASRLRLEIEQELNVVRPSEASGGLTPFEKAYNAVRNGNTQNGLYVAFFYRAQKDGAMDDGRVRPYTEAIKDKRAGEDYLIQAAVMPLEKFRTSAAFLDALEGRLFVVRLLPLEGLVSDTTAASPFAPLQPADPNNANSKPLADFLSRNAAAAYPVAVLPATAEFFEAVDLDNPGTLFPSIQNGKTKPLLSLNLGFNR